MEIPAPSERRSDALASGVTMARKVSTSSSYLLPSGKFPFETHFDVLRRFMTVSRNGAEPVEPAAVEGHGVQPQAAQLNAAFLADIGFLVEEMPGRFKPTPVAMQFINTQIADEARARRLMRSLIENTWFAETARTFLKTAGTVPFRDEALIAELAAVAHTPARQGKGAFRVLVDYLAYAGILVRSEREISRDIEKPIQVASGSSGLQPRVQVAPPTGRPEHQRGRSTVPSREKVEWEVIETSEFHLEIQPEPAAVKRLRQQLDLLDQKLRESVKLGADG